MAFEDVQKVYDCVRLTSPTQQAVLVALAYHRHRKYGWCYPSHETLARETRLVPRTVRKTLNELRKKGYISWVSGGRKSGGRPMANSYTFNLPSSPDDGSAIDPTHPTSSEQGECERTARGNVDAEQREYKRTTRGNHIPPNHNITRINKPQPNQAVVDEDEEFVKMFNVFWESYPKGGRKVGVAECRKLYCSILASAENARQMHATILFALETWIHSVNWDKKTGNDKFIPYPVNWLANRLWEDSPSPTKEWEQQQALAKMPHNWGQCEERCLNCKDGSCLAGHMVPPNEGRGGVPANRCHDFKGNPEYLHELEERAKKA